MLYQVRNLCCIKFIYLVLYQAIHERCMYYDLVLYQDQDLVLYQGRNLMLCQGPNIVLCQDWSLVLYQDHITCVVSS